MTFSLVASGPLDEVKNTLVQQAEQYAAEGVGHVVDLLDKLLGVLDAPHGVSVSVSGHTGTDEHTFSTSVRPLPAPPGESASTSAPPAVS